MKVRVESFDAFHGRVERDVEQAFSAGNDDPVDSHSVASLDLLRKILTPQRHRLVRLLRRRSPQSIYQLAQWADRDRRVVTQDLLQLSRIGLVRLKRRRIDGRLCLVPVAEYDSLQIEVSF